MTEAAKKLFRDALALSEETRTELVAALSDSLDSAPTALSPEWSAEVGGRIDELEAGEVEPVEWAEVEARIRSTLAQHR